MGNSGGDEEVQEDSEFPRLHASTEILLVSQSSDPQELVNSTGPSSSTQSSTNASTITSAPSVVSYSQVWVVPQVSVNIQEYSKAAAVLQDQMMAQGLGILEPGYGTVPWNLSGPLTASIPSIASGNFIRLSAPISSTGGPIGLPRVSATAAQISYTLVPSVKAAVAWSRYQSNAAKASKAMPSRIDTEDCFSLGNGLSCCYDKIASSAGRAYVCNQGPRLGGI